MMQNLNFLWLNNFKEIPLLITHMPERISALIFDSFKISGSRILWGQVLLSDLGFCEMSLIPLIKSLVCLMLLDWISVTVFDLAIINPDSSPAKWVFLFPFYRCVIQAPEGSRNLPKSTQLEIGYPWMATQIYLISLLWLLQKSLVWHIAFFKNWNIFHIP